jgi:hypothetical protein
LFHSLGKAAADAAVSIEQHHRRVWNLDVIHSCRSRPSKHPFFWYFRTAGQFFEPLCQAREFVLRHLFWRRLRPILKAYVVAAPTLTFWAVAADRTNSRPEITCLRNQLLLFASTLHDTLSTGRLAPLSGWDLF